MYYYILLQFSVGLYICINGNQIFKRFMVSFLLVFFLLIIHNTYYLDYHSVSVDLKFFIINKHSYLSLTGVHTRRSYVYGGGEKINNKDRNNKLF